MKKPRCRLHCVGWVLLGLVVPSSAGSSVGTAGLAAWQHTSQSKEAPETSPSAEVEKEDTSESDPPPPSAPPSEAKPKPRPVTRREIAEIRGLSPKWLEGGLPAEVASVEWPDESSLPLGVASFIALLWISMVACLPFFIIKMEGGEVTKTQLGVFALMWLILFGGVYLFTNVLYFQSIHFSSERRLTIIEAVYLMSQILTTVGYGDITPARPRAQVFVAIFVLMSLLVIANVVSEVAGVVAAKSKKLAEEMVERGQVSSPRLKLESRKLLQEGSDIPRCISAAVEAPEIDFSDMALSLFAYVAFALTGAIFFHMYPGEEKTLFQGVYMSVITLSTVGFGAFTPVTEGGKVFAAFWMLFGSASLVAVVSNFCKLQEQLKARERLTEAKLKADMLSFVEGAPEVMNQYEFLMQSLICRKIVSSKDVADMEIFFEQHAANGKLKKSRILQLEQERQMLTNLEGTRQAPPV
mmetsp:Transcript_7670/g.16872  ORF Transcript_7670/g.16872 Transcript_7670/m.16872 type:complete len:468 (+) Transcript_7670:97-1500(+)